jgi:hypothetical protein
MMIKQKGRPSPSEISGPILTYQRMLITLKGSIKILILCVLLSACGAPLKINGVQVKQKHRKVQDARWLAFVGVVGYAVGLHYKEDLKKLRK